MKAKHILACAMAVIAMSTANVTTASAQDEDYFNQAWWSCELTGNQTVWNIIKYKEGMSWFNQDKEERGTITFSDDCIEINCYSVMMHFPVGKYKKITDRIFSVTRQGEDDYFDYIEVIQGEGGREKGTFRFLLAKQEEDGTMQNTHIFVCKPAAGSKSNPSGVPTQVRRLK